MAEYSSESSPNASPPAGTSFAVRVRNLLVVLVAIVLSTAIFFGLRTETNTVSLTAMAEAATPLEVALSNGKPSLMEFYANWCTSCQAMAGDMDSLKQEYGDRVNFVMLNVDNSKWLPELLHYRVDGIPHFVFLDEQGEAIASLIGEHPRAVMATDLDALINGAPIPNARSSGQVSKIEAPVAPQPANDDPRSHGSQVVQ